MAQIISYRNWQLAVHNGSTSIDWQNDVIRMALVDNMYTPELDSEVWWDDIEQFEVAGANYTPGGVQVQVDSVELDSVSKEVRVNVSGTHLWEADPDGFEDVRFAVIYKDNGDPTTSPLVGYVDFGIDRSNVLVDLIIIWPAAPLFRTTPSP